MTDGSVVSERAPRRPAPVWFATDLYVPKLLAEDTGGSLSLFEVTAAPESPPLPHMHHREDETYYVLDGEFEFMDNDRTFRAGAGSSVFLPRDRFHSHRNPGDAPAMALVLYTPGGNIEAFLAAAGKPAADPTSLPSTFDEADIERIMSAAPTYGFETPPEDG
jgi:mannose-6-phosphate isomerase-like protein (cupin superfamily)